MSAYQKVPTQQILSLEEEVYLESLAVLSEMDKHEELVRVTLDTPPASPGCSPMVRQHTLFSSPMARENDTDDGFYRNNEDTVQRIYSTEQSMEEDYWIRFQDLPEYKAYQCVRSLRKRKYSYVCWMTLLLLCSVLAVTKIYTTTLANSGNDSSAQSIHVYIQNQMHLYCQQGRLTGKGGCHYPGKDGCTPSQARIVRDP